MKMLKAVMVVGLLYVGLLVACTPDTAREECKPPRCIVYGLTLSPSGIDPHINQSSELGIVLRQVYDTLVYRHPQSNAFVSGLAERWDISADGLVYTFYLKQGVTFHDGEPFNAQAVARNIDRILDPALASQRAKLLLGTFERYEVVDAFTIRFILSQPYSALLDGLSQVYLGIASPKALDAYKEDVTRYQFHQVGSGAFRFVEYLPENRIVIERVQDYAWKPEFYGDVPEGAVERVEFRFYRDPAVRLSALESGTAHIMGEILPTDARGATSNERLKLYPVSIPGQPLQFYFNTKKAPTDRLQVRQALIYAINRTLLSEAVFQGFSPMAWGALSAVTTYYAPSQQGMYAYDLASAQTLLAEAGYQDSDGDGVLDLNGEPLTLTIVQPPWGLVPQVVQLLQDQWRSIGVRVNVEPVTGFVALTEKVREGDYNLVSFDTFGLDPSFLNARFLSDGAVNWTGYADSELDSWLRRAASETSDEAREQLYGLAQERIMSQALILPIRDYVNINAAVSNISGLIYDPYGWFPLLYGVVYQN
jgi:peptide/nickel transport system substrate-binding protein